MNTKSSRRVSVPTPGLFSTLVLAVYIAGSILHTAAAQGDTASRDNYFPNTEELAADGMRIIALGTGTPNFRRSQASAAWLVELGNGEKFLFDIGTGSLACRASRACGPPRPQRKNRIVGLAE